ncbi:MAG: amino acid adenylation domain-containing protein [Bilifractor sp.]|jgi:D-alanine--poly(phosphoribitol) ligase subunit 1
MAKLVMEYLEETVKKYPDKAAYIDKDRTLTFSETRQEALHIAGSLVRRQLFKMPVAVYLEKSVECIPAMLGIAYSGNFYTILDTQMPETRIRHILSVLEPAVILTDRTHKDAVDAISGDASVLIYEDAQESAFNEEEILSVMNRILPTDVLYVLFTSGSTGTAKGVVTPHRAVVDYVDAATDVFHFTDKDVMGNEAPLYFVMSLLDVYSTLRNGSTTCIIPRLYFSFPALLMRFLAEQKVTVLYWVPSELVVLANLKALKLSDLSSVRMVMFGGEIMPIKQLNMWREALPQAVFINQYGPTETTDGGSYFFIDREFPENAKLPIGKPFRNYDFMVLDENGRRVTRSEDGAGELCVRSNSLTYGYYRNPELTDRVFTQNPLNSCYEEKIYHTGDLVQYNERGELIFIGRKDFQIKYMGQRIELGDIEANVSAVKGVEENCCVYNEVRKRIVLFYTGQAEESFLSEELKKMLPAYMIPGRRVRLDSMPHNLNGKIDRAELKKRAADL